MKIQYATSKELDSKNFAANNPTAVNGNSAAFLKQI
jgi:hypothetical protein